MVIMNQEKRSYEISLQPSIAPPLVLIDAIARSGKAIFSDLIPSLTRMEHIQFCTEFELTIQGLALNSISSNYANAFLRIYFNELSYNLQISRNVNFRKSDQTGIPNYRDPSIYLKRLEREDGDSIVEICRTTDNYIPISTHELLVNYEQLEKLEIEYRMISLWRNPVEIVYSWIKRGWGHRYTENDPRSFMFNIRDQEKILPWHFAINKKDINQLSGAELCTQAVINSIDSAVQNYKKNPNGKIFLITFEEICIDPNSTLNLISGWLNIERTEYTSRACIKAKIPRVLERDEFNKKINFLKAELTSQTFERLLKYSEAYEDGLYGMRRLKGL